MLYRLFPALSGCNACTVRILILICNFFFFFRPVFNAIQETWKLSVFTFTFRIRGVTVSRTLIYQPRGGGLLLSAALKVTNTEDTPIDRLASHQLDLLQPRSLSLLTRERTIKWQVLSFTKKTTRLTEPFIVFRDGGISIGGNNHWSAVKLSCCGSSENTTSTTDCWGCSDHSRWQHCFLLADSLLRHHSAPWVSPCSRIKIEIKT